VLNNCRFKKEEFDVEVIFYDETLTSRISVRPIISVGKVTGTWGERIGAHILEFLKIPVL
jgi:hypothetical protein